MALIAAVHVFDVILTSFSAFHSNIKLWPKWYYTNVWISLGKIKFLHQGHCGAGSGHLPPTVKQETIDDCRKECSSRAEVRYLAYSSGSDCACYKTDCTNDGRAQDFMAYEIIESGYKFCNDVGIALFHIILFKINESSLIR